MKPKETLNGREWTRILQACAVFFILTFDLKFDLDYLKTTDTLRYVPHITL